ncbi:MAG TPA: two-component regulator propeller domain-containing protein [Gemmatimonadales bacterium]|nr:two-component regulator propeller domain-containing protein [Gemmatimonadales bacterium]
MSAASAQAPAPTFSQLYHTAWTIRDGAPTSIEALAQTTDGFLWLGSGTGLFRFDGVRFELFEPPAHQRLLSTIVSALCATRDTGLWVGYRFGGVSLIRRGTIQSYGERDSLPLGTVIRIVEDSSGTTWVGTTNGLASLEEGHWRQVGHDEGLPDGGVSALLVDRKGRLWVSAEAGLFMRGAGAKHFVRVGSPLTTPGRSQSHAYLQEAPDGAIWGSSADKGVQQLFPAPHGRAGGRPARGLTMSILIDRSGALWSDNPGSQSIERFWLPIVPAATQRPEPERLSGGLSAGEGVLEWFEDREGNVWAGTNGGLDRFRPSKLNRVELPLTNIALGVADSGALWVGSYNFPLFHLGGSVREFPEVVGPVEMIYRDPVAVVWFGSPRGLWQSSGGRLKRVSLPDVKSGPIQAATRDAAGDLWISIVRSGVYRRTGERWTPFGGLSGLPREPAIVLTSDGSGRTWFGYTGNRVAILAGSTVRLFSNKDGLSVGNVLSIHVRGPNVWVGGEFGLAALVEDHFRPVIGRDGTEFRGTSGIVETPDGEVWLHGAIGITRIPAAEVRRVKQDPSYRVDNERLDFRDGLEGAAMQIRPQPTVIAGTDGKLWFATTANLAWIDPRKVLRNTVPPPVVIRRLTADNVSYPIAPELRLPVHTKSLRIDYTGLSLSIPERVRFRYQLVGTDTAWQDAGGRREAFYTNLAPGAYSFKVIAANEDGVWNHTGASLNFTIPPSFAQTRWFLAVWVAALAGLAWMAYLGRMRQVASGLRLRYEAALAERTRIAQDLHDTLLQGFTGITLQLRAIERLLVQRPQESAEALKQVLASADTALRDARHMIWDMRAVELEGQDLAEALEPAARQAMAGSPAELVFTVHGERRRLPLAVETTALRVGREAVLNAVKHAGPRTVEVTLEYGARSLGLRVVDDGTGIPPSALESAAAGEHLGIAGMRERAQRVGGKLEITSEPDRGTTISMSLPIGDV